MEHETARVSPARIFARPEAGQIWLGERQKTALAVLARPAPVRVLLGQRSSGKTTLLRHWASLQDVVLLCRGPKESPAAVLGQLLLEAQLEPLGLPEIDQRNVLSVLVRERRSQGRRVVVAIDDADLFAPPAWEEIERLIAWRDGGRPALDVVLAGPPPLGRILRNKGLVDADTPTAMLEAPSRDEIRDYLDWRLAPYTPTARLTDAAKDAIAELARSRYSAVDILAQMALLLAQGHAAAAVDRSLVREAAAALAARRSSTVKLPTLAPAASAESSGAFVVVSRAGKVLEQTELKSRTLLGRSQHNDIVLANPGLSRHHAAILGTTEGYYVVDLNSKNGVAVNGREARCVLLNDGDVIALGPFRVKFRKRDAIELAGNSVDAPSGDDTAVLPVPAPNLSYIRRIK